MWAFLLSAAVSAGASLWGGKKQKEAAEQNASVLEEEAALQEEQAGYVKESYYDQADKLTDQGSKYIASQKLGYANAGVKSSGSPLLAEMESRKNINQDITRLRNQGDQALELGLSMGDLQREKADILKNQGQNAMTASVIGAGSSLLGGFAASSPYTEMW